MRYNYPANRHLYKSTEKGGQWIQSMTKTKVFYPIRALRKPAVIIQRNYAIPQQARLTHPFPHIHTHTHSPPPPIIFPRWSFPSILNAQRVDSVPVVSLKSTWIFLSSSEPMQATKIFNQAFIPYYSIPPSPKTPRHPHYRIPSTGKRLEAYAPLAEAKMDMSVCRPIRSACLWGRE